MRVQNLNKIVADNARAALDEAIERASTEGGKLNKLRIARKMTQLMGGDPADKDAVGSTYRMLNFLLDGERKWSTEWIEAFCAAVTCSPDSLFIAGRTPGVTRATASQIIISRLGPLIDRPQARVIAEQFSAVLEKPRIFKLFLQVSDVLLKSPTQKEADFRISEIIRRSKAWQSHSSESQSAEGL